MGARVLYALMLCVGLDSCTPQSRHDPKPPEPAPVAKGDCERAHLRLVELDCEQQATPNGLPFGEQCEIAAADGRNWRPDCIAMITSCDQVGAAYSTPEGEPCSM